MSRRLTRALQAGNLSIDDLKAVGRRLRPGDRVRIISGQYKGQLGRVVATFQGRGAPVVNVDNVGRRTIFERRLEPWGGDLP